MTSEPSATAAPHYVRIEAVAQYTSLTVRHLHDLTRLDRTHRALERWRATGTYEVLVNPHTRR